MSARNLHNLSRSTLLSVVLGASACVTLLWVEPAAAQTQDERAMALGLFEQGRQQRAAGDFAAAASKFEGAAKLMRTYGILLNLAECYEHLGRTASAWSTWREAQAVALAANKTDDERRASERIAALEPHLSYLRIQVSPQTAASEVVVSRNDVAIPAGALSSPLPLDPGPQRLQARASGYRTWSVDVVLRPDGDTQTITIPALEPEAVAPMVSPKPSVADRPPLEPVPAPTATTSSPNPWPTVGWIAAGTGLATTVVGVTLWQLGQRGMNRAIDDANQAISATDRLKYDLAGDDWTSAKHERTAGVVVAGVGAVLCGTGVAVALGTKRRQEQSAPAARATIWTNGGGAGVLVMGAF